MANASVLSVDLSAICANYRLLKQAHSKGTLAAVVKANAYGLGVEAVSRALWEEGCREFFVATLEEAIELRTYLPEAWIGVFNGFCAGEEKFFAEHTLLPVLNTVEQVKRWVDGGWWMVDGAPTTLITHIDTGMSRLGLSHKDLSVLATNHHPLTTNHLLLSHLACANDPAHPKNTEQLSRFKQALALFPGARGSLANSSGIFLSSDFHFDLGRPGCALYGINPTSGQNPMQPVATLSAPLLQIRSLDRDETIGYGATYPAPKGSRIAIVALGYADGVLRSLSNAGYAYINHQRVPFVGRVSMDMVALDISAIPESMLTDDVRAEFLNAEQTVDDVAHAAGTIGYEIFTRLGARVKRVYIKG